LRRLFENFSIDQGDDLQRRLKNDLYFYFYDQTGRVRGVWSEEENVLEDEVEIHEKKTIFQAYNHEEKEASRELFDKASKLSFGGQTSISKWVVVRGVSN
jgi:hypothetical protein